MIREHVIRAWKDEAFRAALPERDRSGLPPNPAGTIELDLDVIPDVAGAAASEHLLTFGCCNANGLSWLWICFDETNKAPFSLGCCANDLTEV